MVADDLPRNLLGAYGASHGLMPELNGLARRGVTFSSAYTVAPLCTPSRYALLTGTYASRGARDRSVHTCRSDGVACVGTSLKESAC